MTNLRSLAASVVKWVQGEPAVAHYLGAVALTALAHYGVHLDASSTALALGVLGAAATGLTRSKVSPAASAPVGEKGHADVSTVLLAVIAVCVVVITWHYLGLHG